MADSNLKTYVSDKLMSLLGYSQATLVQFVIGLSEKAGSPGDLLSKLEDNGFPSSTETRSFSLELYARVPRKTARVNLYQKEEREAAMLARKQRTYQLLDADDDEEDGNVAGSSGNRPSVSSGLEPQKADTHKKRFRKKMESDEDEDNEAECLYSYL
ncbi:Pre-mRNA-splicing factor ATP-dependent RNA helicase DEAH1 [Turnera subulata]|uniref:Pre-mRNA-splicing factor ATP-dependent RNA helicase DEAH1 n=1 Tax=Turnera subulata TaxID=218843 RepID=A0A9Q0G3S8_9ROSI|nr:Pre-mRNA-splicing factor ATP-dependent RNA helicase DEAH1 [Turnera subulata]